MPINHHVSLTKGLYMIIYIVELILLGFPKPVSYARAFTFKERYIAGSSTCSTKELSIHLTKILSAVKEGQQKYCENVYSRSGINHMWILKNSKDLSLIVEHIAYPKFA